MVRRRHRGGKRATTEKWERWQLLASAARFVVELLELIRNHISSGGGRGRLAL
jgi:hypothetical protein